MSTSRLMPFQPLSMTTAQLGGGLLPGPLRTLNRSVEIETHQQVGLRLGAEHEDMLVEDLVATVQVQRDGILVSLPHAQPHEPEGVAPRRLDGQVQQLSTKPETVVNFPDVELLHLEPCFETRHRLRATPVQFQIADRFGAVEDPGGIAVRVGELRGDGFDGERALDVRRELGRVVVGGEDSLNVSAFRAASCSAPAAEGVPMNNAIPLSPSCSAQGPRASRGACQADVTGAARRTT